MLSSIQLSAAATYHQRSSEKLKYSRILKSKRCSHQRVQSASSGAASSLPAFISWLQNNGVADIGVAEAKIGLYQSDDGERGVACLNAVKDKEVLLRFPMHLAIHDHSTDCEETAPWNVRLAKKLLALRAKGANCPFFPYISVLPSSVPSPLVGWSWEEIEMVEYQPALEAVYNVMWSHSNAWSEFSSQMTDETFSREEFDWAISCVSSRTFGTPGKGGGVEVRMLVPFFDMINHGGDIKLNGQVIASDNVRWDLTQKIGGEWLMLLSSTRAIQAGEELLMSYGERPNEDFLVHYGFVPPHNPHDRFVLFDTIEEGIDWHIAIFNNNDLTKSVAMDAARSADVDRAVVTCHGLSSKEAQQVQKTNLQVKAAPGGLVDEDILVAFDRLAHSGESAIEHSRFALKTRALQLLCMMPASLLSDLRALSKIEGLCDSHNWSAALNKYKEPMAKMVESIVHGRAASPETIIHSHADHLTVQYRAYKKMILYDLLLTESSEEEFSKLTKLNFTKN